MSGIQPFFDAVAFETLRHEILPSPFDLSLRTFPSVPMPPPVKPQGRLPLPGLHELRVEDHPLLRPHDPPGPGAGVFPHPDPVGAETEVVLTCAFPSGGGGDVTNL